MNTLAEIGIHNDVKSRTDTCDTHGVFEAHCFVGSIWSKCPTCNAEAAAKERDELEAKQRDDRLQAWRRRIGEAEIPERFQNRSLQSFVAETEQQAK